MPERSAVRPSAGTSAARAGAVGPAGPRAGSGPPAGRGKAASGPSSSTGEKSKRLPSSSAFTPATAMEGTRAGSSGPETDGVPEASPTGASDPAPAPSGAAGADAGPAPPRAPSASGPPGTAGQGASCPAEARPACASRRLARGGGRFRADVRGSRVRRCIFLRRGGLRAPLAAGRCILRPVGAKGGRGCGASAGHGGHHVLPGRRHLGDATGKREAALVAVLRPVSVFGMAVWTVHADNSLACRSPVL